MDKTNIQCKDIRMASMTYGKLLSKNIEWDIHSGMLTYRNLISPTLAGRPFPDGYFEEKSLVLEKRDMLCAEKLMTKCLDELAFEKELDTLPDGASCEAYLRLKDGVGREIYYTNAHVSEDGFSVQSENPAEPFIQLFDFLKKRCSFPYEGFSENDIQWIREEDTRDWIVITDEE